MIGNIGNAIKNAIIKNEKFSKNIKPEYLLDRILETFPKKLCKNLIEKLHIVNFLELFNDYDVKIYDGRQYAQGFYPYIENLTRIELPISVEERSYCYYVWWPGRRPKGRSENNNATDGNAYFKNESNWDKLDHKLGYAIYGKLAWEKPGDGIENHYGIFDSPEGYMDKIKKWASLFKGENIVFTRHSSEPEVTYHYLDLIDVKSDADDVVVFFIQGHADGMLSVSGVKGKDLAELFSRMKVKAICAMFDSCYSGNFVYYGKLRKDGYVILSSCSGMEMESSYIDPHSGEWPSAFVYFMYEAMKNGLRTAESAFEYAREKVEEVTKDPNIGIWGQLHPQMFDGYPTRENNKDELPI